MSELLALPLVLIALLAFAGGTRIVLAARRDRALTRQRALQDFDVRERAPGDRTASRVRPTAPRVVAFGLGLVAFSLLALPLDLGFAATLAVIALGAAAASCVPGLLVARNEARRRAEIAQHLPESIELLDVCVATGMGLDSAWSAVARQIRTVSEPVADEMERTTLELELGVARSVAVRHMAERTRAEDLSSLVSLLIQSDRYGVELSEPLRGYARALRERRGERAGELVDSLATRMVLPALFLVLPALLIVTLGPILLRLTHSLSNT